MNTYFNQISYYDYSWWNVEYLELLHDFLEIYDILSDGT